MSCSSRFPSLHNRKEGRAALSIRFRAATEADAAGVVFLCFQSENHPGLASAVASRFLLVARPPLLAVVQGGEYAFRQFIHTLYDRAYSLH
jgi:hypothetical protein